MLLGHEMVAPPLVAWFQLISAELIAAANT